MAGGIPPVMINAESGPPELSKIRVVNKDPTLATIPAGRIVYVVGNSGGTEGILHVALASGTGAIGGGAHATWGLLLVTITAIEYNDTGLVAEYAFVEFDTTGLSVGDPLYLKDGATGEVTANASSSASKRLCGHVTSTTEDLVLLSPSRIWNQRIA